MKDRFKFRIFEKESKEMFELDAVGYSSFDPFGEGISRLIMIPSGLENTFHYNKQCLYDNDKFSKPMQCTGLKDKHGKLIYEGDILYLNSCDMKCVIEWHKPSYRLMVHILGPDDIVDFDEILNEKGKCPFEVIGNIYENPELLRKEE